MEEFGVISQYLEILTYMGAIAILFLLGIFWCVISISHEVENIRCEMVDGYKSEPFHIEED